jgi:hypothetical protein
LPSLADYIGEEDAMPEPRELALRAEEHPMLPEGTEERFSGYARKVLLEKQIPWQWV